MSQEMVSSEAAAGTVLVALSCLVAFWKVIDGIQKSVQTNPNPELIKKLTTYCNKPYFEFVNDIVTSLQYSFHKTFGKSLSIQFFRTSSVFSLITVVIMTLVWSVLRPNDFALFLSEEPLAGLTSIFLAALVLNLLPDILSLWQTLKIVNLLKTYQTNLDNKTKLTFYIIFLVAADIILTILIASLVLYLYSIAHVKTFMGLFADAVIFNTSANNNGFSLGIFFYSTFATTIWTVMWSVACALQLSERIWGKLITFFSSIFDSSKNPLDAIFMSIKTITFTLIAVAYLLNLDSFLALSTQVLNKVM